MSECSKTTCVANGTRQITGTDSDATPTPFLLTLPTHGFLYDSITNVQITSPGGQTNAFYYKPEAYYVGGDSYQFYVQDVQGSSSVKLTGQIVVSHKPYPPVAQFNGPLTTPEETPLGINVQTVNIIAYKNDGVTVDPTVTVYISNFTTNNSIPGKLYQYGIGTQTDGIANAGSQITPTLGAAVAIVNSNFSFIYVPPPNTYGPALSSVTFYVVSTDNLQSNVIVFPIDVTFVPKSPVPISSSVTFAQNTPTPTVTPLQITDPNNYHDGPTILTAKIESLPSKNYTLVRGDGTAVVVGDSFQATAGFVNDIYIQTVTPGAYQFGSTSFTFSASNNFGKNSVQVATVNVTITPIILAPGAFAPTPITVTRTVPYTFTLTATDPQPDNTISLVYSSSTVGSAGGVFSDSQSKAISAALTTLASGTESGIYTTTVSFLAPALATGNDYANFTFYSQIDTVKSDPFTVHVNVAPNNNPTANPLNVSCQEDSHTDAFSLTGDDADVADKTSLTFVLTTLPPASAGVLTVASTGAAAVTDTPYSFTSVQLVFTPVALQGTTEGFYGTTSFSFTAVDQLGGASQEAIVTVNVEHVNHQPTASAPGINTTQNSVASFAVTYSDVDTMDSPTVAYIQILSATVSGQLLTQSGQVVTGPFPFNGATNSFQFQFRPNKDTFGNLGSITLVYNDAQNASNSASATVTVPIFYAQVPYPPIGDNTNVTTDQGVPVTVTFPGSDQDSPISTVTIQTFPAGGIIKRPDGTQVTSANPTIPCTVPQVTPADLTKANTITSYTASCQAIYVPYTTNTAGDSFTYTVTDTTGLSSSTYSASVTVIANRPPPIVIPTPTFPVVNNNTMIIDVLENSLAIFSVRGASQDGDLTGYPYSWRLYLTSTVARGDLEFYNTADDGTYTVVPVVNVASNGTLFYASSNLYQFKFQPPQNVFGANFANFQFFVRDPNGDSIVWTIIFNVIHVPQTPILSAVTYQVIDSDQKPVGVETPWDFTARSPIVGIENTDVVISWNATSIDVDTGVISWLALQTVLVLSPQKGAFYAAYKQADGSFKIGDQIEKSTTGVSAKVIIVPRDLNNDKLWRVVFRPVKNDHAYVYSTFTLEAIDTVQPGNLTSLVRTANIRIKSVPAPPTAQWAIDGPVNNHTLIQLTANSVIISGNVTAPDAGINPIAMNVTLVRVDGQPITTENITLAGAVVAGRKKNQCSYVTPSFVTCKDNTIKLNSYLSQVVLVNLQTSVIYNVVLQVNSLGAGADKGETDLYSIEVSDVAVLKVNPASIVAPIPQKNNNALAGIIAGASVAGAFAAFGAFRLIRKSNPPITGFFGEEAFAGNAITDNPLYEQSGGNFDNPLYHHETA